MFNLKEYAWDMWQLSKTAHEAGKHTDVGVEIGTDLFLNNVRAGEAINAGAGDHDWAALKEKWDVLSDKEKAASIGAYTDRISTLGENAPYFRLVEAFNANDKAAFMTIINE